MHMFTSVCFRATQDEILLPNLFGTEGLGAARMACPRICHAFHRPSLFKRGCEGAVVLGGYREGHGLLGTRQHIRQEGFILLSQVAREGQVLHSYTLDLRSLPPKSGLKHWNPRTEKFPVQNKVLPLYRSFTFPGLLPPSTRSSHPGSASQGFPKSRWNAISIRALTIVTSVYHVSSMYRPSKSEPSSSNFGP